MLIFNNKIDECKNINNNYYNKIISKILHNNKGKNFIYKINNYDINIEFYFQFKCIYFEIKQYYIF